MSDPLRIGIVGLGFIGTVVGGQFYARTDATVTAVCDLDQERLTEIGDQFDVDEDHRYAEYDQLLETAPIDAVLIGTPHTLHYDQVVAALADGLHVYCDKPLTTDSERARDLVTRAEDSDRTLMVGYQRHLQTAFRTARERWQETDREPTWVTASMTQGWIEDSTTTWRLEPELSGGGFLYDTGSHVLDAICWTTGLEPVSVAASMDFHDEDQQIDSRAHLDITFANGATGTVSLHGDAPAVRESLQIWDDNGAVSITGKEWRSRRLTRIDSDSAEYTPYIDPTAEQSRAGAFLKSVSEGTEPPATAMDAFRVTALTEAAYEAAKTGDRVTVDQLQ